MSKYNKIRHIVRIRHMLRQWRRKARVTASSRATAPPDVPAGHVAVCVGAGCRRFVVRATHLNHPVFKRLLSQAEEEYGFGNAGPLAIPCDESTFEEILRVVSRSESGRFSTTLDDFRRCCHAGIMRSKNNNNNNSNLHLLTESRPLLGGVADKSVC